MIKTIYILIGGMLAATVLSSCVRPRAVVKVPVRPVAKKVVLVKPRDKVVCPVLVKPRKKVARPIVIKR